MVIFCLFYGRVTPHHAYPYGRERVVAFVEKGHSHRSAAARFWVSVKFVNDMVILKREIGVLESRAQGNGSRRGCMPNPI